LRCSANEMNFFGKTNTKIDFSIEIKFLNKIKKGVIDTKNFNIFLEKKIF
jgi:hypothetical protein